MKITYTPNPLYTTIELDEHEQKELWYKIKIEQLEEHLSTAAIHLDPKNAAWIMNATPRRPEGHTLETLIEEVRKDYLDMDYIFGRENEEKSELDQRVDMLLQRYLEDLQDYHCGDCTCQACSCSKCHAEVLLGIHTTKGLSSGSRSKIAHAFGLKNERGLDEVIEILRTYEPVADWAGADQHVERWKADAKAAYEWLVKYRTDHFTSAEG